MPDLTPTLANSFESTNQSLSILNICDTFNARCDSQRVNMYVSQNYTSIPGTPQNGAGILFVEGQKVSQASGIFIACKSGNTGQVNELMQVAGTDANTGETYEVQWVAGKSLEIKTSGAPQNCYLKWRS